MRNGSLLTCEIQLNPINDSEKEQEMLEKLVKLMKANDAPKEQYERLGIDISEFNII